MQQICSCKKKSYPDPRDYQFSDLMKKAAAMPQPFAVAPKVSLRSKFPPVYDQGQHGTCTSCAALACDDYYYHREGKRRPSILFTYYNQKAPDDLVDDDGDNVENALKKIRKFGSCKEKIWPYTEPWNKKPSKEAYVDGLKGHEITTFHAIKNITQLKSALSQGYPCPGALDWAFTDMDENYILNTPKKRSKKWNGHAIVFIGYDQEKRLIEIRNSWSDKWGDNGYAWITYEAMNLLQDWDDTYAIVR